MSEYLLEARELTKRFGDFTANDAVSLAIRPGEKHALLGENGAGKSTLVKMLYGILQPTAGEILWKGAPTQVPDPAAARAMGIGMVFQHFSVFEALNVAENIALALPPENSRDLAQRIAEVSTAYGLGVDPDRPVHTLSVGEKQRVEIIRCLLQSPELIIMDEPTSVLTPQEADALFGTLNRLAEDGCAILYISHKLQEVRALCETATVLRRAKVVATCDPRQESARSLAEMMVGSTLGQTKRRAVPETGPARLVLEGLSLPAPTPQTRAMHDISLSVHGGEIVGIAGVAGEGQDELMAALIGERRTARADTILVDDKPLGHRGPSARRRAGAAFVPEERNGHAAVVDLSLSSNILLSHHRTEHLAPGGWLRFGAAKLWARRVREHFDVRAANANPVAGSLSGGNLQKFVVGREILRKPGVLVVSQPTWGVDAGAAALIRQALVDLAGEGTAVLVLSQDLEELFEIADRIAVIHDGHLSDPEPVADLTPDRIGLLMAGASEAA
ncbi:MAG: ABC transporter ATP-binding protein [Pseudomonadota bacterium]